MVKVNGIALPGSFPDCRSRMVIGTRPITLYTIHNEAGINQKTMGIVSPDINAGYGVLRYRCHIRC